MSSHDSKRDFWSTHRFNRHGELVEHGWLLTFWHLWKEEMFGPPNRPKWTAEERAANRPALYYALGAMFLMVGSFAALMAYDHVHFKGKAWCDLTSPLYPTRAWRILLTPAECNLRRGSPYPWMSPKEWMRYELKRVPRPMRHDPTLPYELETS